MIKLTMKMMAMMITLLLKMVVTMAMVSCNFETSGLWYLFEVSDVFSFQDETISKSMAMFDTVL